MWGSCYQRLQGEVERERGWRKKEWKGRVSEERSLMDFSPLVFMFVHTHFLLSVLLLRLPHTFQKIWKDDNILL